MMADNDLGPIISDLLLHFTMDTIVLLVLCRVQTFLYRNVFVCYECLKIAYILGFLAVIWASCLYRFEKLAHH